MGGATSCGYVPLLVNVCPVLILGRRASSHFAHLVQDSQVKLDRNNKLRQLQQQKRAEVLAHKRLGTDKTGAKIIVRPPHPVGGSVAATLHAHPPLHQGIVALSPDVDMDAMR